MRLEAARVAYMPASSIAERMFGLVSRFRGAPYFAARFEANFGIEGHEQLYDSSAALKPKFAIGLAAIVVRTSGSRHWPQLTAATALQSKATPRMLASFAHKKHPSSRSTLEPPPAASCGSWPWRA